jgi:hypothetical protein
MPSQALASTCLVEFELHGRLGRVEPEFERSIAPRTVYRTVTSDTTTAAGLPGTLSKIDSEPQLFGCVRREAQLTSVSRSTPAERPYVGSVFYLLPVGLIAAAIIAVFFGIAFSGLTHPKGKTVIGGPVKSREPAYWSFRVNIDFFQGMLSRHNSAMRRLPGCCGIERQVAPVTQLIIVMPLHGSSTRCIWTFTSVF